MSTKIDWEAVIHDQIKPTVEAAAKNSTFHPRKVFLFSGHMIDLPDRSSKRFPPEKAEAAKTEIGKILEQLDAGAEDLALTQGACGGDVLFTEACQSRGVRVKWLQPFDEPDFIQRSVSLCGGSWLKRYNDAKAKLPNPPHSAPAILGKAPVELSSGYSYERCNLWLLETALSYGVEKVHFIALWNGEKGNGPGGTAHMYEIVDGETGQVHWIKTQTL